MLWNIDVASWACVVGRDPEMADYDNPRGEIVRERFYVVAEAKDGSRRVFTGFQADDRQTAAMFARTFDQVSPDWAGEWLDLDPRYGSDAYVREGVEGERYLEERFQDGY